MDDKKILTITAAILLSLGSLFLLVETMSVIHAWNDGEPKDSRAEISVTGTGDAFALPNTAEFSFTVMESAKTVADAQAAATILSNKALAYLKTADIADKDIQTESYDIEPQYATTRVNIPVAENVSSSMPCIGCDQATKQTIIGYQASENIDVKVHDTSKAGTILAGIGSLGVQNVSGLSLTVDNQDAVTDEARTKAIADAQSKAQILAQELGVSLVRITSFSDDSGMAMPYAERTLSAASLEGNAPVPQVAVGQNKTTSNVTITYEIR